MSAMNISIVGAGVAGLTCAVELASRGASVEVFERAASLGPHNCSWFAGGMLAPSCELENAEPLIAAFGEESMQWWKAHLPSVASQGTLVVTQGRDVSELTRFAQRTTHAVRVDDAGIAALEPDLAGRFRQGLFFADEAHLDPRDALRALADQLPALGGRVHFGVDTELAPPAAFARADYILDCTGLGARQHLRELRGVKGEMLLLRSRDISLQRPIRLLHPRVPVYVVPRADQIFMVGATMIESDDTRRITARSMLELLSAAYALHPAFGEAEILEIGTQVRPAFPDNLPRIVRRGRTLYVNGLYRHGFLVAPALARRVAQAVLDEQFFPEVMHEDSRQRQLA
jgi:glycine oxidase